MQKIFLFLFISFCIFGNAQSNDKTVKQTGAIYQFDTMIEIESFNAPHKYKSKYVKFLNTKNDEIIALIVGESFMIFDYKNNLRHYYTNNSAKDKVDYLYTHSVKINPKNTENNSVTITKIGLQKYKITQFENNRETETIIAQLEKSDPDLANSYFVESEILNPTIWLNDLRKLENNQNFVFTTYQFLRKDKILNENKTGKILKTNATFSVPKDLKFLQE